MVEKVIIIIIIAIIRIIMKKCSPLRRVLIVIQVLYRSRIMK